MTVTNNDVIEYRIGESDRFKYGERKEKVETWNASPWDRLLWTLENRRTMYHSTLYVNDNYAKDPVRGSSPQDAAVRIFGDKFTEKDIAYFRIRASGGRATYDTYYYGRNSG